MSGTFWTIEQVEPIIKERNELRQRVEELEEQIRTQQLEARELHRTIARIHEEYRPEVRKSNQFDELQLKYKQRGERMKWLRAELKKYCKIEPNYRWFDPETGEPL